MKTENLDKVIGWITSNPGKMKKEIATGTGLSTTAINNAIALLMAQGKVKVSGQVCNAKTYEIVVV